MGTVAEIKAAIDRLSLQERCELEALLHPFEDDDWDRQMKRDAAASKFGALHREAEAEHAAGKSIPLTDILRDFDDDWDRQMAEDAKPGGKLHRLMEQAEAEAKAGKLVDLSGILH